MSSEVKLILQNGVKVNTSTGNFKLNLAGNYLEGKRDPFLSENDEFMINSLNVNIDTNNTTNQYKNYTNDYESYTEVKSDLLRGEIKYVCENLKNSDDKLEVEKQNLKDIESALDKAEYKEWKKVIPHLLIFHVNFKGDVFGLKEFNIATKYDLALIKQGDSTLRYKGKVENNFLDSKYSFLKHLNKVNSLYFYHQRCELKLVNNVTA